MSSRDKIASHIASCESVIARIPQKPSTILKSGRFRTEIISLASLVLIVAGSVMLNYKMPFCFKLLFVGGVLSAWIHYRAKLWTFVIRDLIFLAVYLQGILLWH